MASWARPRRSSDDLVVGLEKDLEGGCFVFYRTYGFDGEDLFDDWFATEEEALRHCEEKFGLSIGDFIPEAQMREILSVK